MSLFALSHSNRAANSMFNMSNKALMSLPLIYIHVSSAYSTLNKTLETLNMSLTTIIKNRGPRFDPWGTPHLRVCSADFSQLK